MVNTAANYWINPNALSITLNALGEANRLQACVASGAAIVCYIRGVDGLGYDNAHNYKRWPLVVWPTYFNSNTERYLYAAIPRTPTVGSEALIAFSQELIDIHGKTIVDEESQEEPRQLGSDNYYYIWLQGIISEVKGSGSDAYREWKEKPQTGTLSTDEAIDSREENWYRWDPVTQTVTFLKEIWMDAGSVFRNLIARAFTLNGHTLNGVAVKGETPSDSDDTIVTPAYLEGMSDEKYLRKDRDDKTPYSLGVGGNLNVDGDQTVGGGMTVSGDTAVNGTLFANQSIRTDEIRSSNYTGDTIADTGYLLTAGLTNGLGHSKLTIDEIYVRMKAVFESLEVRKWSVVAGDEIRSCAANVINRVDYFNAQGQLIGYSTVHVPWLGKRVPFLLKLFGRVQSQWGRYLYSKMVRMRVTLVDTYDEQGRLVKSDLQQVRFCRCYFLADDGDTQIENWWQPNDLVRCQTMNVTGTARNNYTTIQRKAGNVFWWRKCIRVSKNGVAPSENPDITNCQPALIDEKTYHWFDVAFDGSVEYDPATGQMTGRTDGNWFAGSDIPAAGDHAVQFGNTTIVGRMNLWITMVNGGNTLPYTDPKANYDPNGDAPCIKGFAGIYTFDLTKCYTGGHPCKMTLAPGKKYHFYGREFRIITEYGEEPVPVMRGKWTDIGFEYDEYLSRPTYSDDIINTQQGIHTRISGQSLDYARKCYWHDQVSHKGCLWLCSIADGSHWIAEESFSEGGTSYSAGQVIEPGTYSSLSTENKAKCRSCQNYTTAEPDSLSSAWTKIVDRGTSVISVESRYQKKPRLIWNETLQQYEIDPNAGTVPPDLDWEYWKTEEQIADLDMKDGDYFWTLTKTEFSDTLEPVFEYKVVRWGIDGDGITTNTYFLGLSNTATQITPATDTYLMPGASGWDVAPPQGKWFDSFDDMALANGGVGQMQGWNVWTKTVIHYDRDENRAPSEQKPDLIYYQCSHMGQDGQIAAEEYYMLAASDDFNIVFGSATPAKDKIGIVWYRQNAPASERWRLAESTQQQSNINTDNAVGFAATAPFWTTTRPIYDKAIHGDKIYLWNFEYRVDGQGTPYATRPICVGNSARGITGFLELYALSVSGVPRTGGHIPQDIYEANGNSETDYSHSDPTKPKTWDDEMYNRAPTEHLPYQWNWTRTIYSTKDEQGRDYEDRYHISSVRGTRGEDGAGTESIYCRTKTATPPTGYNGTTGTAPDTDPSSPTYGQRIAVSGTVTIKGQTVSKCRAVDDFVPDKVTTGREADPEYVWTDNPVGVSHDYPYEWVCERKSTAYSNDGDFSGGHLWSLFSDPKPRSKWGFNGVDGDGTEYVFMRTKNNVAPTFAQYDTEDGSPSEEYKSQEWRPYINNKGTASGKANAESNRCSDDPKGPTRSWPYEWVAKREMGDPDTTAGNQGHRDWKSYHDCMEKTVGGVKVYEMVPWSNYAENAIRLDIDNEMDMVRTSDALLIEGARDIETVVHLYDGATEIDISSATINISGGPVTSGSGKIADYSATASGKGKKLKWSFIAGKTMAEAYEITISYTYAAVSHTYTATFTVLASKGQPIYQLKPTLNSINFTRQSDNTLSPDSRTLGLKIVKIDGASTAELASVPTGYSVRWAYDDMPTASTGREWTSGNVGDPIPSDTSYENVCIVLFWGTVVVDRETIPILKDGMHGENAIRLDLDNENDTMLYSSSKGLVSGNVLSTARLYDGSREVSDSASVTWSVSSSKTGNVNDCVITSGNSRNIVITGMNAMTAKVTVIANYTDGHGNQHEVTSVLTLKKIIDGDKYELIVRPNAVAYNITTDYPDESTIAIEVWKMSCDGVRALSAPPTGYGVYANGTALTASTTGKYSYTTDNSEIDEVAIKIAPNASSDDCLDYETVPVNKAENGTSPWIADLDNEMDSVSCDDTGYPVSEQTVYTGISLFYGNEAKSFKIISITKNGGSLGTGVTVDPTASSSSVWSTPKTLSVTYATTARISGKDEFAITIRPSGNTTDADDRVLHFTVNGVIGDVYNLKPSVSQIKVAATATTASLKCGYKKNVNGTITEEDDVNSQIDSKYNVYFVRRSVSSGSFETTYWKYTAYKDYLTSLDLTNWDAVELVMSTNTGTKVAASSLTKVIDREVVPVVKDGTQGPAAVGYSVVFSEAWAKRDKNGHVTGRLAGTAYKIEGSTRTPMNGATIKYGYTGGWNTTTTTNQSGLFSDDDDFDDDWTSSACSRAYSIYASIMINSVAVCTEYIDIAFDGNDGQQGSTGRMFYQAGEWKSNQTYERTDTICPIVEWNNKYWYLDENSSYNDEPGQGSDWVLVDNFGVIFTEALFTMFGKLGGFVVAGDFFISIYGQRAIWNTDHITYVNSHSPSYTHYTNFDPDDPMAVNVTASSGMKFRPELCINAVTGECWFARGNFHVDSNGNIEANNGSFKGTISAKLFYADVLKLDKDFGSYSINLNSSPYYTFYVPSPQTPNTVYLPTTPSSYEGVELRFISPILDSDSGPSKLYCYNKIKALRKPAGSDGEFVTQSSIVLKPNRFATVKSMDGYWWTVDDGFSFPTS